MQPMQPVQPNTQHRQAVAQLALSARHRGGCKPVTVGKVSPVRCPTRSHIAASWSLYHTLPMHCCCSSHKAGETRPTCEWRVERFEGRAAVQQLPQVCRLVCELFFSTETDDPLNSVAKLLYQLELFGQLFWRFRKPKSSSCLLTVHDRISSRPQALLGMIEVSTQQDVPKAVLGKQEQAVAVLTTMVVREHSRKQGIGTALLTAAEEWTQTAHPKITSAALFVYRNNHDAIRLYRCNGFEKVDWTDPEWLRCAEKGQLGPRQRLLFVKPLK